MAFPIPHDSEHALAGALLSAWSAAGPEFRPHIEALIADYAARKPAFVDDLKQVTASKEQIQAIFAAAHAVPLAPTLQSLVLHYMTRQEGGKAAKAELHQAQTGAKTVFPQKPYNPEFSLAFWLLNAWSVADEELRPKIEALIADYVARKPEFVDQLKRVTTMSEVFHLKVSEVRTGRARPEDIDTWMMHYITKKEGDSPSA